MVRPMIHRIIKIIVETSLNHENKIAKLENRVAILDKQNDLLLRLLRDIEKIVDTGDQQQVSVGIKRWRHELEKENLLESNIQPGLVRE